VCDDAAACGRVVGRARLLVAVVEQHFEGRQARIEAGPVDIAVFEGGVVAGECSSARLVGEAAALLLDRGPFVPRLRTGRGGTLGDQRAIQLCAGASYCSQRISSLFRAVNARSALRWESSTPTTGLIRLDRPSRAARAPCAKGRALARGGLRLSAAGGRHLQSDAR
jgi:hypothetical protein